MVRHAAILCAPPNRARSVPWRRVAMLAAALFAGSLSMPARAQSADDGYDPKPNGDVYALAVQADGKILIDDRFTTVVAASQIGGGVYLRRDRLARLNPNGWLDIGFDPADGADDSVAAIALQPDGKAVFGGGFTQIAGAARDHLARLVTAEAAVQSMAVEAGAVNWRRSGTSPELERPPELSFSVSGNAGKFAPLGTMQRVAGGWRYSGFTPPSGQSYSLRAQGRVSGGFSNVSSGLVEATVHLFGGDVIFRNGFE